MKMKITLMMLVAIPLIYLLTALTLILPPVGRTQSEESLDFEVLSFDNISEGKLIETHFSARDGNSLFYRYLPGQSDVVVVLLHGSGFEGQYLLTLAEKLNASLDVTVVIPDLRGHGESALGNMGDIRYLGQFEHDLEDLNQALRAEYPNAKIILGGHSSGGGLAVRYGSNALTEFDGYILLAPYLGYDAPTVRPNSGGWVQVSTRRYLGLIMLNNVGITGLNSTSVLFFNRPEEVDDPLQADSYSYRLNESFSPQAYAENLQANKRPILTLVGQDDEAFYADKFEAVFRENASQAELHIIPDTKHLDLPSRPETNDRITEWLERNYE